MHKISFLKLNGAGNDFILFDFRNTPEFELTGDIISGLCHRNFGIGGDGVLVIKNGNDTADFALQYYNSDGKPGSLCGNGSRSAIVYAGLAMDKLNTELTFECGNEIYSGIALNEEYGVVSLKDVQGTIYRGSVQSDGVEYNYHFLNTGSPHAVINYAENFDEESFFTFDICTTGKKIRLREDLFPGGTNVNFYIFRNGELFLRTFERGVENETLACGTGSVAAAIIASENHKFEPPCEIHTQGGAVLKVSFNKTNSAFTNVQLEGPVQISFTGNVLI